MTAVECSGRAVITGGAGFIGGHLAERLLASNADTVIIDDLSSGFLENIPKGAGFLRGDVRNEEFVRNVARDAEVIFHLAEFIPNIVGHVIRYSSSNPKQDLDVCVGGTINFLEEARRHDCHFVLASTAAVYGSSLSPVEEQDKKLPISAYGISKLSAEMYALLYHRTYGIPLTIVRFFNVFGARQRKYLMYDCLFKMRNDPDNVELLGTGNEIRDYIEVHDVIDQILSLIPNSKYENEPIFNIGTGVGRNTKEVVNALAEILQIDATFRYAGQTWLGTSECLIADTKRTRKYYSGSPKNFEDSLKEVVSWFYSIH